MKYLNFISFIAMSIALSGCVTSEQVTNGVRTLKGKHISEVIDILGYPDGERTIEGTRIYTWYDRNTGSYSYPTTSTATTYIGTQAVSTTVYGTETEYYDDRCTLDLILNRQKIVTGFQIKGNTGGCGKYASLAR